MFQITCEMMTFVFLVLPARSNSCGNSESSTPETAPLTIFYNGTVTVFNVHRHNVRKQSN